MAKLFRKNELNQVARRRYMKALLRATCILGLASVPLSVSAQELLAPPALPSMEAMPVLPSSQPSIESVDSQRGVSLVLRATRLLGLKKMPQVEWAAIDSQLPQLVSKDPESPTNQEPSPAVLTLPAELTSPAVAEAKETAFVKSTSDTEDSLESLLTVDLAQSNPVNPPTAEDEKESLIAAVSMSEVETQNESQVSESQVSDTQSTDSLLDIELASDTVNSPSQSARSSEIVKRGPSMQLRVGPSISTVRLSDAEDSDAEDVAVTDRVSIQHEATSHTVSEHANGNSKPPELAKPTNPKMVIAAVPLATEDIESKNGPSKTKTEPIKHELAEAKAPKVPEPKGGLVEPALPTQFSLNDRDSEPHPNQDSQDSEAPLSKALAMSIESLTKSKASNVAEKSSQPVLTKDLKAVEPKMVPVIQSVSAQVETKSESLLMRPTTPPTLGQQLEVQTGETQAILLQSSVLNTSVEHPDYCQVVKNGDKSLSVIGLKPGKTRIAIFSAQNKVEIREVAILGAEDEQSTRERMAKEMSRVVEKMYRSSSVEVVADEEGLVVQGFAESENEAKKIIRMIRQSSLMPVVDRLSTYK